MRSRIAPPFFHYSNVREQWGGYIASMRAPCAHIDISKRCRTTIIYQGPYSTVMCDPPGLGITCEQKSRERPRSVRYRRQQYPSPQRESIYETHDDAASFKLPRLCPSQTKAQAPRGLRESCRLSKKMRSLTMRNNGSSASNPPF